MPRSNSKQEMYTCCQCNNKLNLATGFYKTNSKIYSGTGHLPICKDCIVRLFNAYSTKYDDVRKSMKRICMAFDLYYDDSVFDTCNDGTSAVIGNYIKRLNMVQYKGRTFDTSLSSGFDFNKDEFLEKTEEEASEKPINPEYIEKWGYGFDGVDYDVLSSHYRLLKDANPNCDSNQEIFINDLCYTKMQQMKAVREGRVDDYNKLTDSYRKSFQQAGLKTVKDTSITEDFTIGINAETIEKYTPAEYYKNKQLYKDYDNIGDYIERFLLRPLRNLMTGTRDRDIEYFVKEEDDSDVYADEE